jgi:hypothetical protein
VDVRILKGQNRFLTFNKGNNGAGTPIIQTVLKTDYLWKEQLKIVTDIIQSFINHRRERG